MFLYTFLFLCLLVLLVNCTRFDEEWAYLNNELWPTLKGDGQNGTFTNCTVPDGSAGPFIICGSLNGTNTFVYGILYVGMSLGDEEKLSGSIPPSLATSLPSFGYLSVTFHNLHGTLPILPENMTVIQVSYNSALGGSVPPLPTTATFIDLAYCNFSDLLPPLPPFLEHFDIQSNAFSGPLPPLPSTLKDLYTRGNRFSGAMDTSMLTNLSWCQLIDWRYPNELSCFQCPPTFLHQLCYTMGSHDDPCRLPDAEECEVYTNQSSTQSPLTPPPPPPPSPPASLPARLVFRTSATFNGSLGGLAGADLKCNEAAAASTLLSIRERANNFIAWLSSSSIDARTRLGNVANEYSYAVGGDGDFISVAESRAHLLSGSDLLAPINRNEHGLECYPCEAYTGTNRFGVGREPNCIDWENSAQQGIFGAVGLSSTHVNHFWTEGLSYSCSNYFHLICFEGEEGGALATPTPAPTQRPPSSWPTPLPTTSPPSPSPTARPSPAPTPPSPQPTPVPPTSSPTWRPTPPPTPQPSPPPTPPPTTGRVERKSNETSDRGSGIFDFFNISSGSNESTFFIAVTAVVFVLLLVVVAGCFTLLVKRSRQRRRLYSQPTSTSSPTAMRRVGASARRSRRSLASSRAFPSSPSASLRSTLRTSNFY